MISSTCQCGKCGDIVSTCLLTSASSSPQALDMSARKVKSESDSWISLLRIKLENHQREENQSRQSPQLKKGLNADYAEDDNKRLLPFLQIRAFPDWTNRDPVTQAIIRQHFLEVETSLDLNLLEGQECSSNEAFYNDQLVMGSGSSSASSFTNYGDEISIDELHQLINGSNVSQLAGVSGLIKDASLKSPSPSQTSIAPTTKGVKATYTNTLKTQQETSHVLGDATCLYVAGENDSTDAESVHLSYATNYAPSSSSIRTGSPKRNGNLLQAKVTGQAAENILER